MEYKIRNLSIAFIPNSYDFKIPIHFLHSSLGILHTASYLQLTPLLVDCHLSKPFVKVAHSAGQRHSHSQILQKYTVFLNYKSLKKNTNSNSIHYCT